MSTSQPQLHVRGLTVAFNSRPILQDLSAVFGGGLHFLLGLNGSGKSTLLRAILGISPHLGSIYYNQSPVAQLSAQLRARTFAWIPQRLNTAFDIPCKDFVLSGRFPWLSPLGNYGQADHARVREALALLECDSLAQQSIQTLSGGELQRVLLARAWVQDCPVWLLDEPAQSLDPKHKHWAYQWLAQQAQHNKIMICATHDTHLLAHYPAQVWAMQAGQLSPPQAHDALTQDWLNAVYGL